MMTQKNRITLDMIKPEYREMYTQEMLDARVIDAYDLIDDGTVLTDEELIAMNLAISKYHKKVLSATVQELGKYGLMRLNHLKEFKLEMYVQMLRDETLLEYCKEIDKSVKEMIETERKRLEHLKDQTLVYVSRCKEIENQMLRNLVFTK